MGQSKIIKPSRRMVLLHFVEDLLLNPLSQL